MGLTCSTLLLAAFIGSVPSGQPSPGACPDLTGRYVVQGEDGRVLVTIRQDRCARMTIKWGDDDVAHGLRLDGIFQPDVSWFGARDKSGQLEKQMTSAQFRGPVLWLSSKRPGADPTGGTETTTLTRVAAGDLCVGHPEVARSVLFRARPEQKMLFVRLRGRTRAAEDDAAGRSDNTGCDTSPTTKP